MQQGTFSSADRLSQGVIAWPQVRRIPKNSQRKELSLTAHRFDTGTPQYQKRHSRGGAYTKASRWAKGGGRQSPSPLRRPPRPALPVNPHLPLKRNRPARRLRCTLARLLRPEGRGRGRRPAEQACPLPQPHQPHLLGLQWQQLRVGAARPRGGRRGDLCRCSRGDGYAARIRGTRPPRGLRLCGASRATRDGRGGRRSVVRRLGVGHILKLSFVVLGATAPPSTAPRCLPPARSSGPLATACVNLHGGARTSAALCQRSGIRCVNRHSRSNSAGNNCGPRIAGAALRLWGACAAAALAASHRPLAALSSSARTSAAVRAARLHFGA